MVTFRFITVGENLGTRKLGEKTRNELLLFVHGLQEADSIQYCSSILRVLNNFQSELSNICELGAFASLLPKIFDHILDPLLNEVRIGIDINHRTSITIYYPCSNGEAIQSSLEK